jgi:peptidase E
MNIPRPRDLLGLIDGSPEKASAAIIPNAKDYLGKEQRDDFIDDQMRRLGQLGLRNVNVLDLGDYVAGNGNQLRRELAKHSFLWVPGGNTFALRYLIRTSGLEDELPRAIERNELTYGGYSAGSIVAGTTLEGFNLEASDDPRLENVYNDPRLVGKTVLEGLSIVPYKIIPHVNNPDFQELTEASVQLSNQEDVVSLTDDQALVSIDGTYRINETAI